jgi:hypothetical protein
VLVLSVRQLLQYNHAGIFALYIFSLHFQALGNFYFIHESLSEVLIWDFSGKWCAALSKIKFIIN